MIDENPKVDFNPAVTIVRVAKTEDVTVLRELYERSKLEGQLRINAGFMQMTIYNYVH